MLTYKTYQGVYHDAIHGDCSCVDYDTAVGGAVEGEVNRAAESEKQEELDAHDDDDATSAALPSPLS